MYDVTDGMLEEIRVLYATINQEFNRRAHVVVGAVIGTLLGKYLAAFPEEAREAELTEVVTLGTKIIEAADARRRTTQ